MRVTLIGFMGSGKSTVAPLLAKRLGWRVLELDDYIVQRWGGSSITEIFERCGESRFREIESESLALLSHEKDLVVSSGGGAPCWKDNIAYMKAGHGKIVHLCVAFEEVKRRLRFCFDRPLFKDEGQAAVLYQQRLPVYESAADFALSSEGRSPVQVAEEIADWIKKVKD